MKLKKIIKNTVIFLAISSMLLGCNNTSSTNENTSNDVTNEIVKNKETVTKDNNTNKDLAKEDNIKEDTQTRKYTNEELKNDKINELGKVMVLMYHSIGEEESTWTRTYDNFKKDLNTLYEKKYEAISLNDYANGNINTKYGYTPVVFTFDDGNENNFSVIEENGEIKIDPNCAVGIMDEFKKAHPDFNMTATFFLNANPFNQDKYYEYKLNYLIKNGYDIGNHTIGHNNLSKIKDSNKIQEVIGKEIELINNYVSNYDVNTLALPFGGYPKEDNLYKFIKEGKYKDINYKNNAILLVGWDPYKSPFHKDFDSSKIHRVRASEMNVDDVGLYDWLKRFDENKQIRYISDGNPNTIVIPNNFEEVLSGANIKDKDIIKY